jgi:hypothetical protein
MAEWVTPDLSWVRWSNYYADGTDYGASYFVVCYPPFDVRERCHVWKTTGTGFNYSQPGFSVQVLCYSAADVALATAPYAGPAMPWVQGSCYGNTGWGNPY